MCTVAFIDAKSVSYDEGISLWFAGLGWTQLWNGFLHVDSLVAPYYVLVHVWSAVFGDSLPAARALSACAALGSLPAIFLVGRSMFGPRTATIAGVLAATSPFFVAYAQDARPFAVEICAAAWSIWAFVRFAERCDFARGVCYVLISTAAVYIDVFAAFLIVAQAISLPFVRRDWRKCFVAVTACTAVVAATMIPLVAVQLHVGLSRLRWIGVADFFAPLRLVYAFGGSYPAAVLTIVAFALAVRSAAGGEDRRALVTCGLWFFVPLAGVLMLSIYHPAFVARYLACAFPAFVLLVAAGIASVRLPAPRFALAVAIVGFSLWALWADRAASPIDYRAASVYVGTHSGPNDGVVFFDPGAVYAFDAALAETRTTLVAKIAYPRPDVPFWGTDFDHPNPRAIENLAFEHVWLVLSEPDKRLRTEVIARLTEDYTEGPSTSFGSALVSRFDRAAR